MKKSDKFFVGGGFIAVVGLIGWAYHYLFTSLIVVALVLFILAVAKGVEENKQEKAKKDETRTH